MPLFPTPLGTRPTKPAAVSTIVAIAARLGTHTTSSTGGQLFGGHSLRTGGAQYLASLGVDTLRIQSMGRWRSNLVIHYAGDRGALGITEDTRRGLLPASSSGPSTSKPAPPRNLMTALSVDELDRAGKGNPYHRHINS